MGCWESPAGGLLDWLLCWPLPVALISSSTSQCNALDRLAPHHQLSHHHNYLRRWLWQNSLRCFPYTSFPAQCSPPSYEEVIRSQIITLVENLLLCCGWGQIGITNGALKRFANMRGVKRQLRPD